MKNNLFTTAWITFCFILFSWTWAFAYYLDIQPSEHNFGEVEVGASSSVIISISNTDPNEVIFYYAGLAEGSSPDFSVDVDPLNFVVILGGGHIQYITEMDGIAYFKADDDSGPELWRSDGTPEGTYMVKDINPDLYSFNHLHNITNVDGTLFFMAYDSILGTELWKSDGTEAGTMMVKDIYPGCCRSVSRLTAVNGTLYFTANDGVNGRELWKSDGNEAGTIMVRDIVPGPGSSIPLQLTDVEGTLYFSPRVFEGEDHHKELWMSDGTEAGTVSVTDTQFEFVDVSGIAKVNGTLFFGASDDVSGWEFWRSDGTDAGTFMVKDIFPGTDSLGYINSSDPMGFTNLNNRLFFYAEDDAHGRELWTSDGTEAGTQVFKDINPEAGHGVCRPSPAIVMGGILYFEGNDGTTGCELWKSDGTPEGTVRVKDIVPGSVGSGAHSFVAVDGTLFFQASGPEHGWELWKSDGTDAGTVRVKDIMPGPDSSYIGSKADVGGVLFFAAHDGVSGQELWKSDGTEAGTVMVKEINPGPGPSVNIEVSYTPSAPGPAEAVLEILSNDIVSQRQVPLFGMGVSGELPPDEQIAAILALIEESVASGTLTGDGLGKSADGRLKALTNMIEAAGDLIEAGLLTEACVQLQDVYNRCDGESPPPDFVSGTAASELAAMVQALMASAGCE